MNEEDRTDRPQDGPESEQPRGPQGEESTTPQGQEPTTPDEPEVTAQGPRRLFRSRRDRVIAGVGGGLGRYFNVDPIFFRIGFIVAAFFGGAGIFLYLAAWIFVPSENGRSVAGDTYGRSTALIVAGAIAFVIAAIAIVDEIGHHDGWGWGWWWGGFLFPTLLIAAAGVLVWRHFERRRGADEAQTSAAAGPVEARADRGGMDAGWIVGRIALVVAICAAAAFVFVGSALAAAVGGGAAVAALVVAIGALLVIAAFRGGARWLIVPALLIAFPVGVVSAADVDLDGGIGEREYLPTTTADLRDRYELGMGRLELDLRALELPRGDRNLEVDLGIGEAVVLVPRDVCVALDARVGGGYVRLLDRDSAGLDVDWGAQPDAPADAARLLIDAQVGLGDLQVVHDPEDIGDHRGRGFFESENVEVSEGNDACERNPTDARTDRSRRVTP